MRSLLLLLLDIASIILLLHVIFSWVPRPPDPIVPFVLGVRRLVDPVLAPIRRVIPPVRLGAVALDLSIIFVFLGLMILRGIIRGVG